jgi:hypothetical protein
MALIQYRGQRMPTQTAPVNTTQPLPSRTGPTTYNTPAPPVTAPQVPPPTPYAGNPYVGTPANSNMQGFVQGKLGDPSLGTTHKYQGGRYLQQHPGDVAGLIQQPGFAGWQQVGPDKVRGVGNDGIPGNDDDSVYDVRNANGAVQWTAISGPAWDRNGIAGVNSLGVSSALKNNGIRGDYAAANTAAADAARAAGTSTYGYATTPRAPGVTGGQASSYPMGGGPGDPGSLQSSYTAQFSDPSTRQFEQYLMQQMQALEAQRTAQGQANVGLRGQMTDAQGATKRLTDFLGQRASQLQQPAYTGAEQEILRTQMLDPIERDRTAANQRALENVGSRGFDPTSGVAQEMFGQVNRGFDERRASAQGDLAYRQIAEKRSREQEAQALLGAIPGIQRGAGGADLQYLQMLDAAMNKPREQGINLSQQLYRLPAQAQADALQAMGMGGSPDALFNNAMQLYNAQNQQGQYQDQQSAQYWAMLGNMLPYLTGGAK